MMILGSMERALTSKSVSPLNARQLCQWTAVTSLVTVGALALFSASALERLSERGRVRVDLKAFKKIAATTVALDRTDDLARLAFEEELLKQTLFAQAEPLPEAYTEFKAIQIRPKNERKTVKRALVSQTQDLRFSSLSALEEKEIEQLRRVADPALESQALAQVYRRLRFQFIAAVEKAPMLEDESARMIASHALDSVPVAEDTDVLEYGVESVTIAKATDAFEYDSVPVFDASDFDFAPFAQTEDNTQIEVAAGGADEPRSVDSISISASSPMKFQPEPSGSKEPNTAAVFTTSLDDVPEDHSSQVLTTQAPSPLGSETSVTPLSTGPPLDQVAQVDYPQEGLKSKNPLEAMPPKKDAGLFASKSPEKASEDELEYSRDIASAFQDSDDDADYTASTVILGGDYSVQSRKKSEDSPRKQSKIHSTTVQRGTIQVAQKGDYSSSKQKSVSSKERNHGQGVTQDEKGITIAWGGVAEGVSDRFLIKNPEHSRGQNALRVSQSASRKASSVAATASTPEKLGKLNRCESSRSGVEAFSPATENDSLAVCARVLSHEGVRDGQQRRWFEVHGIEGEFWPTLAFSKRIPGERVPLLSSASIRLLSAVSRVNTHSGTGIVFGEVPAGMDIQLIGRADTPLYLDSGMKKKKTQSDSSERRQFVLMNVEPGQPLLYVTDSKSGKSGSIALVTKPGMATYISVPEPKSLDLSVVVLNAASRSESRVSKSTVSVVGQNGKVGITDRRGEAKLANVVFFGEHPVYVDAVVNERGYRNRYRVTPMAAAERTLPLFFFDEKKVASWLSQLVGGVSPFSGLVVGVVPASLAKGEENKGSSVRIGMIEKKSSLVPERYSLGEDDRLLPDGGLDGKTNRFIGVQIPEGPAIPSVIDPRGGLSWSELIYAQPGVINVVGP